MESFACGKIETGHKCGEKVKELTLTRSIPNRKECLFAGFVLYKHLFHVLFIEVNDGLPELVCGHKKENVCMQNEYLSVKTLFTKFSYLLMPMSVGLIYVLQRP